MSSGAARHLLAIDQGTTSTRAIVFDREGAVRALAQADLPQIFPQPGWVEHDPEEIWRATVAVTRRAVADAGLHGAGVAALGIPNHPETTATWDAATGRPIPNATGRQAPPTPLALRR